MMTQKKKKTHNHETHEVYIYIIKLRRKMEANTYWNPWLIILNMSMVLVVGSMANSPEKYMRVKNSFVVK